MAGLSTRFASIAVVALAISVGRADSIYLYNPDGSPRLEPYWDNVSILRQQDKALTFRTASGRESVIEQEKIARIAVDADPALTEADDAFVLQNYDKAVDNYLKAIRTNDAWKIFYVTPRLAQSAAKTGRFDAAMAAYVGFSRIDPPRALAQKPALPAKGSKLLDEGAKQLDTALRSATANDQKQALLSLLLDVQMARGDQAAAEAAANQLSALTGDSADPRVAAMTVGIRLDQAANEIAAGRYDKASTLLDHVKSRITNPAQQARALFLVAQSSRGAAGEDKTRLLDSAIAFMRVAAHFESVEGKPHVGEALLEAALINQAIGDKRAAESLFSQIITEFPDTSLAQEASSRLEQLKK